MKPVKKELSGRKKMKGVKSIGLSFRNYSKMKGQEFPSDLGMTLILLALTVGLLTIGVLVYLGMNFHLYSGSPISYSIDFVTVVNKPYMLAGALSYTRLGDRQIFEQAIESVGVSSVENAQAGKLLNNIAGFVRTYGSWSGRIVLTNESNALGSAMPYSDPRMMGYVENQQCGKMTDGWCVNKNMGCDVGRVEIDPDKLCGVNDVCCKPDIDTYKTNGNRKGKYVVVPCRGEGYDGICSEGQGVDLFGKWTTSPFCTNGQIELKDAKECNSPNNGKTKLCCAELTGAALLKADIRTGNAVSIPLLYKDKVGYLEVEIR